MDPLVFSMAGHPHGKGRPRATVRQLAPKKHVARLYTDEKTRKYEQAVAALAKRAMGDRLPFEGPLSVSLRFRMQPPKSMTKRQRAAALAGEVAYLGRYDVDNLAKAVLDGMNEVCFLDDVQITRLWVVKEAAENPGVDVRIEPLAPQGEAA